MDKENLMKNIAQSLRSVVQSNKGGVLLRNLGRDYKELIGSPIPFDKMGYSNLESMLKDMPDVVRLVRDPATRDFLVMPVADEKTMHIQKMVSKQKDSKSKGGMQKKFRVSSSRFSYASSYHSRRPSKPPSSGRRILLETPPSRSSYSKSGYFKPQVPLFQVPSRTISTQNTTQKRRNIPEPPAPVASEPTSAASSKKGLTLSKTNYEVPPRFLRQQFQVENSSQSSGRNSPTFLEEPRPLKSPVLPPSRRSKKPASSPLDPDSKPYIPATRPAAAPAFINQVQRSQQYKTKRAVALLPALPSQLTSKELVQQYADSNGLSVEYKTKGTKSREFYSVLHLGDRKYYSYHAQNSESKVSQAAAEELAASQALIHINEETKKRYPETKLDSSVDIQMFVNRIETILSENPSGIWSHGMLNKYNERFQESLPEHWLRVIEENSTTIEFERPEARLEIPHNACILRLSKMSSGATTPTSTSSRASFSMEEDQHHHILAHVNSEHPVSGAASSGTLSRLPDLILPDEDEWMVYVCYVASTVNVAVTLVEYNLQAYEVVEEMKMFYAKELPPVHRVIKNKLYAAVDEDTCQRVRVEDVLTDSNEVKCYFIDCGITSQKSISNLRELDSRFEVLPAQAIHIRLHDLENYCEIVDVNLLESLLDQVLVAKIIERGPNFVVELYDTHSDDDINLNVEIKKKTLESLIQLGSLPEVGVIKSFNLIHVSPYGVLYLHGTDSSAAEVLNVEMEKLTPEFETRAGNVPQELPYDKVYAVKYPIDDTWVRALPTGFTEPPTETKPFEVEMFFLDYGNSLTVPLSSVSEIPNWLADLPKLAVECILTGVPPDPDSSLSDLAWSSRCADKIYEFWPDMEQLMLRVDEPATEGCVAKVNIQRRSKDGHFDSINNFFFTNKELFDEIDEKSEFSQESADISPPIQKLNSFTDSPLSNHTSSSPHLRNAAMHDGDIKKSLGNLKNLNMSSKLTSPGPNGELILDRPNSDEGVEIPPAEIPEIGEYFDVYISMVASPSNFIVQPMRTAKVLDDLTRKMNQFYSNEENIVEMHQCLLESNNYFAAHHVDDCWYRAKLVGGVNRSSDTVAVHFVDFGDIVAMIPMTNLQPLWKPYKSLPCQAMKATLSGVKPVHRDWDTNACLWFADQVRERSYVSEVKRIIPCASQGTRQQQDFVLELKLIDTSNAVKDIYIGDLLIQRRYAVEA